MALYFRVTDAGLAAATDAANQGLRLALTRFKLGSSYGYTPTGTETALAGTIVYDEPISSYKNMPDGSMIFVCSVLPAAGPFTFGEIGLFTDAGLLFAVATFPDPQDKYVSSGSSVNSTFTFNCHMNLTQRATQFNLSAATTPAAEIYMRWDQVVPLASMPDPRVLRVVINQPDSRGDQPTLSAKTGGGWTVDGVMLPLLSTAAVNSTTTYVDISADSWLGAIPGSLQSTVAGTSSTTLVVQVDANTFRLATAAVVGGAVRLTYTVALATAATGTVRLYSNDVQLKNTEAFLEQAVAGVATIANVATPSYVLSYTKNATGAVVESRASTLVFNAASAAFNVFAPPGISKLYTIVNNTAHTLSLYNSSVLGGTTSTQPALTVLTGHSTNVWTDGSRFYLQTRDLVYTNTQQTITGPKTFSQPIAGSVTHPFPTGTRMPFAQSSAPTGWTQDVSDNADNRMLRVVNTAGGGVAGTHSPILNNVVPSHTHGFTTGTVSSDHSHYVSGGTSGAGAHSGWLNGGNPGDFGSFKDAGGVFSTSGGLGNRPQGLGGTGSNYSANLNVGDHSHSFGAQTGGISANHTHSGSTDNGSSQTNWQPRYIDLIICTKN
jgi:hypothetical protein